MFSISSLESLLISKEFFVVTFVLQKQASPSDLPPSAHPAALPVGNGHTEVSAVTAEDVSVPSLPEDPVTEPTPPPEPAPAPSGANLLADLLAPLAIEAPPGYAAPDSIVDSSQDPGPSAGTSGLAPMQSSGPADALALALYDGPSTKVQVQAFYGIRNAFFNVYIYTC